MATVTISFITGRLVVTSPEHMFTNMVEIVQTASGDQNFRCNDFVVGIVVEIGGEIAGAVKLSNPNFYKRIDYVKHTLIAMREFPDSY